jgi:hypothetical protein
VRHVACVAKKGRCLVDFSQKSRGEEKQLAEADTDGTII